MSTSKNSSTALFASDTKLVAGLQQNQATLPPMTILGQSYTAAQAVAVFQSRIAKEAATTTTRAAWSAAVKAQEEEQASTKAFVSALKSQLQVWFANNPEMLASYGLSPRKASGPRKTLTKVVAAAKGAKTREARQTMGTEQRKLVKGIIPATLTIAVPGGSTQVEGVGASPSVSGGQGTNAVTGASAHVLGNGSAPHTPNGSP
jgi:hypothetical protein